MPDSVGQYTLLDRIASGAMGELYRARDTRVGRTVAVRLVGAAIADDPGRREAFLADARAAAGLSHPNIATLYEIGEEDGQLFLACEFVPGQSLASLINGRPINPRRAIDLAIQMADALADAHAEGIVDRDLKPDNVIVTPKGNAKILDLGLAAWTGGGVARRRASQLDGSLGPADVATVAYMSPEQIVGEHVEERSDVFSLGVIAFEMLTGRLPFSAASATALALQIAQAAPPAPTSVNPSLPPEVDPVVLRALAKSLDQRYEAAATLAAELRSIAAILEVRSAAAAPAAAPVVTPRGAAPSGGVGWIVLLLCLAALAGAAWWQRDVVAAAWFRLFTR